MTSRPVKFISWNINGYKSPIKRRKILSFFKNNQADIVLIQEIHMQGLEVEKYKMGWVGHIFHSSFSSKRNGVLILVHKYVSLLKQTKDQWLRECFLYYATYMQHICT